MSPHRYLALFGSFAFAVMAAAIAVAAAADPAHIFRLPAAYGEIARLLQSETPVGDLDSPRHRLINRAYIATLEEAPDAVILGSSRIQPFSPREAGWPKTLNLAVEGGDLGDHLYVYGLLREAGKIPARMVITVDPYIFSPRRDLLARNGEQPAMQAIVAALSETCLDQGNHWGGLAWIPNVLTLDYVLESARQLKANAVGKGAQVNFAADPTFSSKGFIKRPDGSVVFSSEIRDRTPAYVDDYAATVLDHPVGRGLAFEEPDPCKVAVFRDLLNLLKQDNVDLSLALLPYHPVSFDLLRAGSPALAKVETIVRQIGRELSIPVVGAYDPAANDCTAREFLDMHHPKQPCSQRILSSLAPRREG
mgnify:CR=1 FL=1